ncbi:hypothetical protein KCU62_g11, partial [Aureobasidium sp. EXF-3399]
MARKSTETLDKKEAKDPSFGDLKRKHESTRGSRRAATKSKYFQPDSEDDSEVEEAPEDGSSSAVVESGDDSGDVSSEALSEDEQRPKKRKGPAFTKATETAPSSGSKGKELWRQGRTMTENGSRVSVRPYPFTTHLAPIPKLLVRIIVSPHQSLDVESDQIIACSFFHNDYSAQHELMQYYTRLFLSAERALHRLIEGDDDHPQDVGSSPVHTPQSITRSSV